MKCIGPVPVDLVVCGFERDFKVRSLGVPWPETAGGRLQVLRQAGRPADLIFSLEWYLHELEPRDLLERVFPVWVADASQHRSWSLREMLAAIQARNYVPPDYKSIIDLGSELKVKPALLGTLVGYEERGSERILLEDGHHRLTAAALANVLPSIVRMYIGRVPQ